MSVIKQILMGGIKDVRHFQRYGAEILLLLIHRLEMVFFPSDHVQCLDRVLRFRMCQHSGLCDAHKWIGG